MNYKPITVFEINSEKMTRINPSNKTQWLNFTHIYVHDIYKLLVKI